MLRILVVLCLVAVVAATLLVASPFAGDERISACAKRENGQLRLLEPGASCLESEVAVSWSAGGGGGGTTFETVTASVPATAGLITGTATCPAGARVVGGGAQADPVTGGNVLADYPASDSAWTATAATNPAAQSFVVYAICASSP